MKTLCSILIRFARAESSPARLLAAAVAATSLSAVTAPAQGGLIRDMALDPQHQSLGQSYLAGGSALSLTGGGAAAIRITVSGVNGAVNSSAAILNSGWAITAWHNISSAVPFGTVTIDVSTGSNFNTNRGQVSRVLEYIPYPGNGVLNPNLPDLCLLRLSDPLVGVQNAVIGSAFAGDAMTMVGFGRYGSPAVGSLPQDGNVRAFRGTVRASNIDGYSNLYYQQANIGSTPVLALEGRGLGGDSGGAVFNSAGHLVGLMEASTNGTGIVGVTTFSQLDTPQINAWITSTIPTPGTAALIGVMGAGLALRRRRD